MVVAIADFAAREFAPSTTARPVELTGRVVRPGDPDYPVARTSGAYVNVPNTGMADWATAYWGAGVDRLRTIKATYDLDDVFTFEQSIPPAT